MNKSMIAFVVAGTVLAVSGIDSSPSRERSVTDGVNPAFSPDGRRLAFQRLEGGVFHLGIVPTNGGDVEWIEKGPGMAAYPV